MQGFDVQGPVQAEVFVLRRREAAVELAGPCGPDPWYVEVGASDDPVDVVTRLATRLMDAPLLVHSTSWRRDRGGVILTFVVVNRPEQAAQLPGVPVLRAELARSSATHAARAIQAGQVLEHGMRHLAWLALEDPTVRATLDEGWRTVLEQYVPEPFQHLG